MSSEVEVGDMMESVQSLETGFIAVHQKGETTWLSWGQTKEEIADSFNALADGQRIGTLGELGGVRSEPAVSAGFSRLEGLVGMASILFPGDVLNEWSGLKTSMPNGGDIPVLYSFRVAKGSLTTATWKVHVPSEFIRDLAALGKRVQDKQQADEKSLSP